MSNKIDPNLLAAGIGGLLGANFMSTGDNDIVATALGAGIGIGTGMMLDTNLTEQQRRQISLNSGSKETIIDPNQIDKATKTFEQRKEEVKKLAEGIAKSKKGSGDYDRSKPYSSLTKENFTDFITELDNIKSDESLTKLKIALTSGRDDLFIGKSDLDKSLQIDDSLKTRIRVGASLSEKMSALREEFIRLGYEDGSKELDTKLQMFEGMLDGYGHKEDIVIKDGKLILSRDVSIYLTYKSASDTGDVAIQSVQNKNIYNVPRVSFTATGHLQDNMTSKAMAEAMGITMSNAFKEQIDREMKEVAGLAPDEAAALAYHRLKDQPEQFKTLVEKLNGMRMHDEVASGQYRENLRVGNTAKPKPSMNAIKTSNTVDYSHSLNFLDNGKVDVNNPFKTTGTTSQNGKTIPEIKQFLDVKIKQTGIANVGTSADHVTEMITTQMERVGKDGKIYLAPSTANNLLTTHTAYERNPVSVYNRMLSHDTSDLPHQDAFDFLLKKTGAQSQFGSALPLQTLSLNSKLEIMDTGLQQSRLFIDSIAEIFGSNITVADGSGLGNRDILRKISTEGYVNLDMTPTADEKFMFTDENHKKIVTGEMSFDEFKEKAKKGIGVIQGNADRAIKNVHSKLNTIKTLSESSKSANDVLNILQKNLPKLYARNSPEIGKIMTSGTDADQIKALQRLGQSKLLASLPKVDALYSPKDISLTDTAIEARKEVIKAYEKIDPRRSLTKTLNTLKTFIDNNAEGKAHIGIAESFFPKAGQVIGYNSDGSEVKLKQNYRSYEFVGSMWNNKATDYSSATELNVMFKGRAIVGDENEIKTYGLGTKAQLQNIEGDWIKKIALLQDMALDGSMSIDSRKRTVSLNVVDADGATQDLTFKMSMLKNKSVDQIFKNAKIKMSTETQQKLSDFKNVAVLLEDDSSGSKKHADLLKEMVSGADLSDKSTSSFLSAFIQNKANSLGGDRTALAGLADFVLATSKDKSAMDFLITAELSFVEQTGLKFSTYTNAANSAEKAAALDEMKRYGLEVLGTDFSGHSTITKQEWGGAMNRRLSSMTKYHNGSTFSEKFYEMAKNPALLDDFANFFINERKNRSSALGDGLLRPTAANRTVEHELGSGTTGKNASWNSIAQLRMNGFSNEDIGIFAKLNSENVADYQAISMMTRRVQDSLDTKLTSSQLTTILNTASNQRRGALESMGVDTSGKLGEGYTLKNGNKLDIKSLPILLEDSRLFGGYTDEEGNIRSKQLTKKINEAIRADMAISEATSDLERKSYQESLENSLNYITKSLLPELGGQNNLGKKVATLEAKNSMYSLASPSAGSSRRYATEVLKDNHVVSVSSKGLLKRFEEMGMEFDSIEDMKKAGLLRKTSEKGVYEVFYDKQQKVPMFSMLTREPSVGMGSTSTVRYLLDESIQGDAKNLYSMFDNEIFKAFKIQDFDADHFIEVLPTIGRKNFDQLSDIYYNKGKKINDQLDKMLDTAKHLGVKGKDKRLSTFFDILDNPEIDSPQKFHEAYLEDTHLSKLKGGDRKTVSPTVTKLAFTMNSALMSNESLSFEDRSVSRMMTHYLVENLLKSQHISNSTYKKDPIALASKLDHELASGRVESFNEKLGTYIEDIIQANKSSSTFTPEIEDSIRRATSTLQQTMISSKEILNGNLTPTHLRSKNPDLIPEGKLGTAFKEGVDNVNEVVNGNRHHPGVVSTVDHEIVDSMASSLAGKAKKSYHTALETTKQMITNNKKILAGAAAATIGAALLTQEKPNFGNNTVSANTNGMLMEASRNAIEETREQQNLIGGVHRATDYLYSYNRSNAKSISVEGQSTGYGSSGNLATDVNNFMFADGMSTIRILTE